MTNVIVISLKNESQAVDASHKLTELESFGDITVYEKVILKKDANGKSSVIQSDTSDGLRTVSGMALGTVVGAFAGPVGMLVGMLTGTLTGALLDADYYDVSEDFEAKVIDRIQPGTVAIIAEVYEPSPTFVDNAVAPFGAKVFRSDVDYVYDDYVDEQVEAFDEQIAADRAEMKAAAQSEKAKIQAKIEALKEKRRKRISELKQQHQAGVAKVKSSIREQKRSHLKDKIYRHQARIDELQGKLKELES